jgi:hypothetical protein
MNIDTYVYVKKSSSQVIGNDYQFNLIPNNDRPFNSIQIVSAVIETTVQTGMLAIRSNLEPLNAYSLDQYSTVIAIFDYNQKLPGSGGEDVYTLSGYEQPKYQVSNNLSNFKIGIMNESDVQLSDAEILHFSIIFKLSYFKGGSAAIDYRAQVPL